MDGLPELYRQLAGRLPPPRPGNPCGTCYACCTATGSTFHHVQEVEHAHIAALHGVAAGARFREFVERRRDAEGRVLHEVCPFYQGGCSIYEDRPFACRVFGHFRLSGTRMPDPCVFAGSEVEVADGRYFEDVPLARELQAMSRQHAFHEPIAWGEGPPPAVDPVLVARARANVNPDDPLDMGVVLHLEGRHDEALALLDEAVRRAPDAAHAHFYRGTVLQEMGRRGPAVNAYLRACQIEPDNPRFIIHLGIALLECGRAGDARSCFGRAVELQPADPLAQGFLGSLLLAEGDALGAVGHLQQAVDLGNTMVEERLAQALRELE